MRKLSYLLILLIKLKILFCRNKNKKLQLLEQYTYIYIFTVYKMTAKYSLLRQLTLFSFLYNHLRNNIAYVNNGYIKDMKIIL